MRVIKKSKQYPLKVVFDRPDIKKWVIFAVLITFLMSIVGSFFLGRYYSTDSISFSKLDEANLKRQLVLKQEELAELEQQVAILTLATEVDRKANEKVRSQVVELKSQLAEMEQDNNFFRSLMRPKKGDQGIEIDAPMIVRNANDSDRYQFNVVIKQIVAQHRELRGYLLFDIIGMRSDNQERISLSSISDDVDKEKIALKFKYFQSFNGEIEFPVGFVPERIELKVVIERPKKREIEKKFGWLVKES